MHVLTFSSTLYCVYSTINCLFLFRFIYEEVIIFKINVETTETHKPSSKWGMLAKHWVITFSKCVQWQKLTPKIKFYYVRINLFDHAKVDSWNSTSTAISPCTMLQLVCREICGDGRKCISFYCYGTFLHTLIAGWDDVECLRVFSYVHQYSPVAKYLSRILSARPGKHFWVSPYLQYSSLCFWLIRMRN